MKCSAAVLRCILVLSLVSSVGVTKGWADTPLTCRAAAEAAEHTENLPAGLLLAIGKIESGRYDPATGQVDPWPWTANLAGTDHVFASAAEATEWTRTQQMAGRASIDVGCFQINLFYHPAAFDSLDEAYDPAANGRYAARFLAALYRRVGDWQLAVAQYHSADPALGGPYGSRVFSAWAAPGRLFAALPLSMADRPMRVVPTMVWSPAASRTSPGRSSPGRSSPGAGVDPSHDWLGHVVVRLSLRARAVRLVVPDVALAVPAPATARLVARAASPTPRRGLPRIITPG